MSSAMTCSTKTKYLQSIRLLAFSVLPHISAGPGAYLPVVLNKKSKVGSSFLVKRGYGMECQIGNSSEISMTFLHLLAIRVRRPLAYQKKFLEELFLTNSTFQGPRQLSEKIYLRTIQEEELTRHGVGQMDAQYSIGGRLNTTKIKPIVISPDGFHLHLLARSIVTDLAWTMPFRTFADTGK
jgi:hypothetical protein